MLRFLIYLYDQIYIEREKEKIQFVLHEMKCFINKSPSKESIQRRTTKTKRASKQYIFVTNCKRI